MSEAVQNVREIVISRFDGMTIDMNTELCIPGIRALCGEEYIIMDFSGRPRAWTNAFPLEKLDEIRRWVGLHEQEIVKDHMLIDREQDPLQIEPLKG